MWKFADRSQQQHTANDQPVARDEQPSELPSSAAMGQDLLDWGIRPGIALRMESVESNSSPSVLVQQVPFRSNQGRPSRSNGLWAFTGLGAGLFIGIVLGATILPDFLVSVMHPRAVETLSLAATTPLESAPSGTISVSLGIITNSVGALPLPTSTHALTPSPPATLPPTPILSPAELSLEVAAQPDTQGGLGPGSSLDFRVVISSLPGRSPMHSVSVLCVVPSNFTNPLADGWSQAEDSLYELRVLPEQVSELNQGQPVSVLLRGIAPQDAAATITSPRCGVLHDQVVTWDPDHATTITVAVPTSAPTATIAHTPTPAPLPPRGAVIDWQWSNGWGGMMHAMETVFVTGTARSTLDNLPLANVVFNPGPDSQSLTEIRFDPAKTDASGVFTITLRGKGASGTLILRPGFDQLEVAPEPMTITVVPALELTGPMNIRQGPATSFASLNTASTGQILAVVGKDGDKAGWYRVRQGDASYGWIAAGTGNAKLLGDPAAVPIVPPVLEPPADVDGGDNTAPADAASPASGAPTAIPTEPIPVKPTVTPTLQPG